MERREERGNLATRIDFFWMLLNLEDAKQKQRDIGSLIKAWVESGLSGLTCLCGSWQRGSPPPIAHTPVGGT